MLILSFIFMVISIVILTLTLPQFLRNLVYPSVSWRSSEDLLPLQIIEDNYLTLENGSKIFGFELLGYDIQTLSESDEKKQNDLINRTLIRLETYQFTIIQTNTKEYLKKYIGEGLLADLEREKRDNIKSHNLRTFIVFNYKNEEIIEKINTDLQTLPKEIIVKSLKGVDLAQVAQSVLSPLCKNDCLMEGGNAKEVLFKNDINYDNKKGIVTFSYNDEETSKMCASYAFLDNMIETQFLKDLGAIPYPYTNIIKVKPQESRKAVLKARTAASLSKAKYKKVEDLEEKIADGNVVFMLSSYILYDEKDDKDIFPLFNQIVSNAYGSAWKEKVIEPFIESLLPYRYDIYRKYYLLSSSLSTFLLPMFKKRGVISSRWTDAPITYFQSHTGRAYNLQFHAADNGIDERLEPLKSTGLSAGHGVLVGDTGSGKTFTAAYLAILCAKLKDMKVFAFDHDDGLYIPTRYMNGEYIRFSSQTHVNPFKLKNDVDGNNKSFVRSFLRTMINDVELSRSAEIDLATRLNFYVDEKHQKLDNLIEVAFYDPKLQSILRDWADRKIFSSSEDAIDLGKSNFFSFDLTPLKNTNDQTPVLVMMYIMNKIYSYLAYNTEENTPALIIVDEAASALRIPAFREWYLQMYERFRKLNAVVISCFQTAQQIKDAGVESLIFQSPNKIILSSKDLDFYGFSEEFAALYRKSTMFRPFAFSKNGEDVILEGNVPLNNTNKKIFGGKDDVRNLITLENQYGLKEGFQQYLNV